MKPRFKPDQKVWTLCGSRINKRIVEKYNIRYNDYNLWFDESKIQYEIASPYMISDHKDWITDDDFCEMVYRSLLDAKMFGYDIPEESLRVYDVLKIVE